MDPVLWSPSAARIAGSALRGYLDWLEEREGRPFPDHDALHAWSVQDLDRFWTSVVDYYGVEFSTPWTRVRTAEEMPHTRWFTGARLNWAQHALRRGADDATALVCVREGDAPAREITFGALRRSVAAAAGWLRPAGGRLGDRVGAYLPNTEHAVTASLAAAAVGAVWACCSPDFGAEGTIGRLAQLEPGVLIATDGYHWNGREVDRGDVVARLREELPTLHHVVHVPYVFDRPHPDGTTPWDELLARDEPAAFEQVEFSHPLWVLFTSGTTGLPKGLVHGHGGITLEGLKWSGLYAGLREGERIFACTSTGWALWNMQVYALTQGASIVLYEGSPGHPPGGVWDAAARTGAHVVLLGAAVVTATASFGVSPRQQGLDLRRLRHLMVSGSALPKDSYRWVLEHVGPDLRIDSTSGGTDVCGAFVGANEYAPVRPGRIGGTLAGVDCAAWDEDGEPVVDRVGELVVHGAGGEYLSVNVLDVTERRAAEAERRARREAELARGAAEAASRAKSDFLSALSHELRTPLQAVTGFTELLGTLDLSPERRTAALGHIASASSHILALVDDVLDIAAIEAGALPVHPADVDPGPLVGEVADLLGPLASERSVSIRADVAGRVRADPRRLRQVLINVVTNAVRYNRPGGSVTITSVTDPTGVTLAVHDTGPGIPPELVERLFVPFDRLGADTGPEPGAGLGLVLARGLVDAMAGRLHVHSSPGRGTTVAVRLPRPGAAPPSAAAARTPAAPPPPR